jgi:CRISPR/Cas system CSM-associated protein Csm3 (group 7 of RAMP superfamily)
MKSLRLTLDMSSYWHAGSGHAGPGDIDAAVVRDMHGLPYLPGRTLKGLFRDAAELWHAWNPESFDPAIMFGNEGGTAAKPSGKLHFSDASLPSEFTDWTESLNPKMRDVLQGLVETVASTKIDQNGIADDHTLRKFEAAIPMTMEATISWEGGPDDDATSRWLGDIATLVRRLGSRRHRGYGRCTITAAAKLK